MYYFSLFPEAKDKTHEAFLITTFYVSYNFNLLHVKHTTRKNSFFVLLQLHLTTGVWENLEWENFESENLDQKISIVKNSKFMIFSFEIFS